MMPIGTEADVFAVPDGRRVGVPGGGADSAGVVVHRQHRRGAATFIDDGTGAGIAVVNLGAPPQSGWWLVDRLVVVTDSTSTTEARVYIGEISPGNLHDITPTGDEDVAEYPRGLFVAGSAELIVQWSGGTINATARASAQVAEERPAGGG